MIDYYRYINLKLTAMAKDATMSGGMYDAAKLKKLLYIRQNVVNLQVKNLKL